MSVNQVELTFDFPSYCSTGIGQTAMAQTDQRSVLDPAQVNPDYILRS